MGVGVRLFPERFGFAALTLLTLSPVLLQGFWRPLAQVFSVEGDTFRLTIASLMVVGTTLLLHWITVGKRIYSCAAGAALAVLLGSLIAKDTLAIYLMVAVLLAVTAAACATLPLLLRSLPSELDGFAKGNRAVSALLVVLGIATVTLTTRLGVFMGDASRPDLSLVPEISFLVHHSCLTAYVEGARLASEGTENLYDIARWPDLNGSVREAIPTGPYAPFSLDAFAYPPPFLLLPRMALSWMEDFAAQRAFWFTLNGVFVAAALGVVAKWLGGRAGLWALLLAPAVWTSSATLGTLQVGNVHLAIMVSSMLALVAFEKRRFMIGGALLAFAILSKISPGLLIIVLLLRGRFREVAWTAAFGLGYLLLSIGSFGLAPLIDFVVYELPRLSSGEALTFLAGAETVPINLAPFGVPFKLAALGFDVGDPWAAARLISKVFTVCLVVLALLAARKEQGTKATVEIWAALLTLSSLRSPLAPGYVTFALLWLLSIRAGELRGGVQIAGFVATWLSIAVFPPLTGGPLIVHSMVQQALVFIVATYCLLRPSRPAVTT